MALSTRVGVAEVLALAGLGIGRGQGAQKDLAARYIKAPLRTI